jgi:hypothetical protein
MTAALPLPLHSPDCPAGIGCVMRLDDRLKGGSMGLRYADIPLRDECELEVRLTRNKMTPIFAK